MQDPHCVFQIVKRHFARYTPAMVEEVCGVPQALFLKVAGHFATIRERTDRGLLFMPVGWTQHSVGVQYIRTAAIVTTAPRQHWAARAAASGPSRSCLDQGSTDIPTLYNLLPGYLPMPKAKSDTSFEKYIEANKADSGWWANSPNTRCRCSRPIMVIPLPPTQTTGVMTICPISVATIRIW
ncbi:MAG: hypothetical protein R2867_11290 [Caldilineaceae bacterium]